MVQGASPRSASLRVVCHGSYRSLHIQAIERSRGDSLGAGDCDSFLLCGRTSADPFGASRPDRFLLRKREPVCRVPQPDPSLFVDMLLFVGRSAASAALGVPSWGHANDRVGHTLALRACGRRSFWWTDLGIVLFPEAGQCAPLSLEHAGGLRKAQRSGDLVPPGLACGVGSGAGLLHQPSRGGAAISRKCHGSIQGRSRRQRG